MYEIHGTLFFLFFFKNGRKNRECLWQILEIRKRKRFFVREGQRMEKERVETVQREGEALKRTESPKKRKKEEKRGKLSWKISATIGGSLLVLFCIANIVILFFAQKYLESNAKSSLMNISRNSAGKVEKVESIVNNISTAVTESMQEMYNNKLDYSSATSTAPSEVFPNVQLAPDRAYEERFLVNTLWYYVQKHDFFAGAGIFLEPSAFQSNVADYSFYVTRGDDGNRFIKPMQYSFFQEEEYYKKVKADKQILIQDPFDSKITGLNIVVATYPIVVNDEFKGVLVLDINTQVFSKVGEKNEGEAASFFDILTKEGAFVYSSNPEAKGKKLNDIMGDTKAKPIMDGLAENKEFFYLGKTQASAIIPIQWKGASWLAMTSMPTSVFAAQKNMILLLIIGIEVVFFVAIFALVYTQVGKALKPLTGLSKEAEKLARGELDLQLNYHKKDEVGTIFHSLQDVADSTKKMVDHLKERLNAFAGGDFSVEIGDGEEYHGEYKQLYTSLVEISKDMNNALTEVKKSSLEVKRGADSVSNAAQILSQGATEQSGSIDQFSQTMDQISQQVQSTAKKAEHAYSLGNRTGDAVVTSNKKMEEMESAMADITAKSQEISNIIKTIDDIAFQTNILSLNAAIEAARAGAMGKGFAVVADEVGNLAQKSAKAAQNTAGLIEETIVAVEKGAKITKETAVALSEVSESTGEVSRIVEEISRNSEEEARGISDLVKGIEQISTVVQSTSATAEECAAASEELSAQSNVMEDLVSEFTIKEA